MEILFNRDVVDMRFNAFRFMAPTDSGSHAAEHPSGFRPTALATMRPVTMRPDRYMHPSPVEKNVSGSCNAGGVHRYAGLTTDGVAWVRKTMAIVDGATWAQTTCPPYLAGPIFIKGRKYYEEN